MTKFSVTLRELLSRVNEASDPVVTKTSQFVCFMVPYPKPELSVQRIDRTGPINKIDRHCT